MRFYVGLHQPSDGHHFDRACISINRLLARKKRIGCKLIVDSGAFTEVARHGGYRSTTAAYATKIRRLIDCGAADIEIVVAQDWMCEPKVLEKTGKTIEEHQRLTIERYDELLAENLPVPVMPVLQGWTPTDYVRHIRMYGDRLRPGAWVGVGSVCKRQGKAEVILAILLAIKAERPDLELHGFGVKLTAIEHPAVRELLATADSLGWSFNGRKNRAKGTSSNDWRHAERFRVKVEAVAAKASTPWQMPLTFA